MSTSTLPPPPKRIRTRTHVVKVNRESAAFRELLPFVPLHVRPKLRGDCENLERPCPFVSCRSNLSADTKPARDRQRNEPCENIWIHHPGLDDPEEIDPPPGSNCALDYASRGGMTLEEVGQAMGLTRERVRQLEEAALKQIRKGGVDIEALREHAQHGSDPYTDRVPRGVSTDYGHTVFIGGHGFSKGKRN